MRVSAKAEYACLAMLELAANYREPQPSRVKNIAETHHIPQRFLVQILLQLKSAGLVSSVRGALGGYQLARSPEQISLADVVNAIDREPGLRSKGAAARGSPAVASLHGVWQEIQQQQQQMLRNLTLTELVRRAQQTADLTYQI